MTRHPSAALVALTLVTLACGADAPAVVTTTTNPPTTSTSTTIPFDIADEVERFNGLEFEEFLDTSYAALAVRGPQAIASLGLEAEFGIEHPELNDLSDAFLDDTYSLEVAILDILGGYPRSSLTPDEQVSYDVYAWYLERNVAGDAFRYHDYPLSFFLTSYNQTLLQFFTEEHPLDTERDAEDYVVRLELIGAQTAQVMEGLAIRSELGITPPDFVIDWTISTLEGDFSGVASSPSAPRPAALALYTTFVDRTSHIEFADEQSLYQRAEEAIATGFVPAWQGFIDHLEAICPDAREDVGLWALPDGDAYYEFLLRHHTTTELTPDEIHQLGITQVRRVQKEMRAVFAELGYPADGDLGALRARARRDGGFLGGDTPEHEADLLGMFYEMVSAASSKSEAVFSAQPAAEIVIIPEPVGRGGYYVPGSADGSRPGAYHAGVQGEGLPRYTMATILYHEATPGHHFQLALAQELDLPALRRFETFTAYVEGWALYAERLAAELGLYSDDPYGDVGRLELELLRAVRLVVDTGIHHRQWTREQARDYIVEAMGDRSWGHEVERYISYPGQATSYMIGQQTILDLRTRAETTFGDDFDIVAFHDVVLGSGSLPLAVLEDVVGAYIDNG